MKRFLSLFRWFVAVFAWFLAQMIRLGVDIRRRQVLCNAVTRSAANAVAYSWTVRAVFVAAATYALWRAFVNHSLQAFFVGAGMYAAWIFAELLWQFVLYVVATISRLDSDMKEGMSRIAAGRRVRPEVSTVVVSQS